MVAGFTAAQMTMWAEKGKTIRSSHLFRRRSAAPEFSSSEQVNDYMRDRAADDE